MDNTLKMYDQREVAQLFGTTRQTISLFREKELLKATKIGRKYMFSSSEIRRFQDENISKNLENKLLEKEDAKWIKN